MIRSVPRFRSFALAALAAVWAAAAPAQQPQAGQPAQMSEVQAILAQKFEPTHLQIAIDVLRASGLMTAFDNAMPNVAAALRMNVTRQRPELAKDIEEALKVVDQQSAKVREDGLSGAARFLAAKLSEAELKEINVFLNTPTGKKYVATLPGFMDLTLPYLEAWGQEAAAGLSRVFQEEMARRGHRL